MIQRDAGGEFVISLNGDPASDPDYFRLSFLDTFGGENGGDDLALVQVVIVSLLTWRRAADGDELPIAGERNGWWGDAFTGDELGSRLWLFLRAKVKADTATAAEQHVREALAWLVTDGIAARVDVEARVDSTGGRGRLTVQVRIFRDDGSAVLFRFAGLWSFFNG